MAEARTQTSRRWLWIGTAVVLIVVYFASRYFLRDRLPVRVAVVQRESIQNTVPTNGIVEPVENHPFYSPIATTVKAVYAQEGDLVPAGKLLLTLDDVAARAQVASAESAVKSAQSALNAATHNGTLAQQQASAAEIEQDRLARDQDRHDLDTLTQLESTGAAAPGEVAAARGRLQTAQASLDAAERSSQHRYSPDEVARAQAALDDAQAALEAARHVEAQTSIYAPIAGTIYSMDVAPSEYADAGKLLLQMADLRHERVRAFFDEPDLGRLATGQPVSIRWDAKPGREWHGHIARLEATVVARETRNVGEVLVDLDGTDNDLLPDMHVTVTVTTSSLPDVLSMPSAALHEQNGTDFAYKVVDGELQRVTIKIGPKTVTQVPILSGLEEGDVVATGTTTGEPLQEGVPIKEVR